MKHYIVVKWNEKVSDKNEYYLKACEAFRAVTDIEGVSNLNVYKSNSDKSNRFDVMIEIECTPEGLANYDVSTLHLSWKENYSSFIEKKAIFDCD